VDFGVRLLVSGDVPCQFDSFRLRAGHFGCLCVACASDSPATRMFDNVLVFASCHDYTSMYLLMISGFTRHESSVFNEQGSLISER
jgi:hypothetical protein